MPTRQRLVIRPYRSGDRDDLVLMLSGSEPWRTLGYSVEDWGRFFDTLQPGDAREAFVATSGPAVAGAAVVRRHFLLGDYLELFVVAGDARRQGVGRRLLKHLERVVFGRARNFFLCVSDFNRPARAFYKREGYVVVGRMPNLLVKGRAEILMRKTTGAVR